MRKPLLLLLLLLPFAQAKIGLYAKDFSPDCYSYTSNVEELLPQSPYVLASFLRDSGMDVEVIEDTRSLERYDAVMVLSCTTLSPDDVRALLDFYQNGGGLLLDARRDSPILRSFDVYKKTYPINGVERSSLETIYVTVKNAVLVSHPIIDMGGPLVTGYEKIYYVGEPLVLPDTFRGGFVTSSGENVLGWKVEGVKRLAVVGCLYCADPLLLANLVDWIEDGRVDFPHFRIYRRAIPDTVLPGTLLVDLLTIYADKELKSVRGDYLYNVGGSYCEFGEPTPEFGSPQLRGNEFEMEVKFTYMARGEPGYCYLPPVLLTLESSKQRRKVIVDPVEVVVSKKSVIYTFLPDSGLLYFLAGGGLLLLIVVGVFVRRESRKRRLIREWEKYRNLIKLTKRRRLRGELSEEAYQDLLKAYEEKLQEIEVEMKMMGINPDAYTRGRDLSRAGGERPKG